jgi:hypothetical protein
MMKVFVFIAILICLSVNVSAKQNCVGCQVVVQLALEQLKSNLPDTICDDVPTWLQATCLEFKQQIIDIVDSETDDTGEYSPAKICQMMGQCSTKRALFDYFSEKRANDLRVDAQLEQFNIRCTGCELIVSWVTSNEGQNTTRANIEALLRRSCNALPNWLNATCHGIVDNNLDALITFIQERLAPGVTCQRLGFCPNNTLTRVDRLERFKRSLPAASDTECQSCQWMVSAIESYASKESSASSFAQFLEELCTLLPNQYTFICQDFVNVYITEILQYLLESLPPPVICEKLTLCQFQQ